MMSMKTSNELRHTCRIQHYPDGSAQVLVCSDLLFWEPGWEPVECADRRAIDRLRQAAGAPQQDAAAGEQGRRAAPSAENLDRARRRARSRVADIARCTDFAYFVTLTLAPDKIDRYDAAAVVRALSVWADNHVRRDGLAYVLVPELHKDGAIHFHGFFNSALPVVDSGTLVRGEGKPRRPRNDMERAAWLAAGGHVVYNLPSWTYGFTTAIELYGARRAAVSYVCKYITKAKQKVGGRWYYSGGALGRPRVEYCDADSSAFAGVARPYAFTAGGRDFVLYELSPQVASAVFGTLL